MLELCSVCLQYMRPQLTARIGEPATSLGTKYFTPETNTSEIVVDFCLFCSPLSSGPPWSNRQTDHEIIVDFQWHVPMDFQWHVPT